MGVHHTRIRLRSWLSSALRLLQDRSPMPAGHRLAVFRWLADMVGVLDSRFLAYTEVDVVDGDLRGRWVIGPGATVEQGVVLYLHGGGFVFGSSRSHTALAQRLSEASGLAVFLLDYRLAPDHPFPAAPDDAIAAYLSLLDRGYESSRIAVAADSAGGHLLCSVLNDATHNDLPMPAAAVLFSPCLDLSGMGAAQRDALHRDPVLSPILGRKMLESYVRGENLEHPRIAVLSADMHRWPPVLIQVGDTECLLQDSERLCESLMRAGVPNVLQVWPDQIHVFQALARHSPDGREALREAGWFLASNIGRQHNAERVAT